MDLKRILLGSPICQKPEILKAFLTSIKELKHRNFKLDYVFADDNKDVNSSLLLKNFSREGAEISIFHADEASSYLCNEDTHHWNDSLMLRVGCLKNRMIQYALEQQYDALFLVDSDLVLNPDLLEHLKDAGKDVISEIFWTSWHPGLPLEPNVWLFDEYDFVRRNPGEEVDEAEKEVRKREFLEQLKKPGVYEVGGLGACTFISRDALLKGVNFSYIPNLTIHGEDRFFCIRAAVLGIHLYVDTTYPAYHIYRPSDIKGIPQYARGALREEQKLCPNPEKKQRITLSMTVRNEEGRYLERVLGRVKKYVDEVVIIDDASEDHTADICEALLSDVPHRLIRNGTSMFANEAELRKKQWQETVKTNPDWILSLDADEVPEVRLLKHLREMTAAAEYDLYGFRLYDMWNETQYREERYWNAHESSRLFLLRYHPDYHYTWKETPQHCGRFPNNLEGFSRFNSELRIQHFGWARPEDRKLKYERYRRLDPEGVYGIRRQYDSIMDYYPTLQTWREGEDN